MRSTDDVDSENTERQNNIEVWNDLVSPTDLIVCLLISVICVVAAVLFWGDWPAIAVYALVGATVVWAHRSNIARLASGTESRIGSKKGTA